MKLTEAGRFGGGLAGGALGGYVGTLVGPSVCAAIGLGSMGVGAIACSLVAMGTVGSIGGDGLSKSGEYVAEELYEMAN